MAQSVLKKVLQEIRHLQPDELLEVHRAVNGLLNPAAIEIEREAALRVLEESGIVREVKRPPMVARPRRPPVPIQGKSLSETIVEEWR